MNTQTEIALGTAQFGLNYGIAGRGEVVPQTEVCQILERAWDLGIRRIDTAPVYGAIEKELKMLLKKYPFKVVSKIPFVPVNDEKDDIAHFILNHIRSSQNNLDDSLDALLFHRSGDLFSEQANFIWEVASKALKNSNIRLGVSCYSPDELKKLCKRFPIQVSQIPGNAFDQRLRSTHEITDVEIHLRSVFLQGILLLSLDQVSEKLPKAADALKNWKTWCEENNFSPLQGALSFVKFHPNVSYCVIGVDRLSQLEEIYNCWTTLQPMKTHPPSVNDLDIIDPRCWEKFPLSN
ncbi:MAG: hypothetical protein A3C44_00955 [Gammaproteobacteria bacterium RIFCSPHIGHO2_02_FULL_39_13]|nr:MAG: hypothetical protein A3C44_00955 [Gammaproteobacteria bacterium RIFCSPHIGHO2_02_FULL_39_13]OGT48504.1 MAG: hypothetical protein A3E53_03885 [Gammaproteobacteria bacterium RIFCSPHIGHO2_12_FULL_39_24]